MKYLVVPILILLFSCQSKKEKLYKEYDKILETKKMTLSTMKSLREANDMFLKNGDRESYNDFSLKYKKLSKINDSLSIVADSIDKEIKALKNK